MSDCFHVQQINSINSTEWSKNVPTCFLSEISQISVTFANFWHTDGQDDRIMWGTLTFHLT